MSLDTINMTPDVVLDDNLSDDNDDCKSSDDADYTEENEAPTLSDSHPMGSSYEQLKSLDDVLSYCFNLTPAAARNGIGSPFQGSAIPRLRYSQGPQLLRL